MSVLPCVVAVARARRVMVQPGRGGKERGNRQGVKQNCPDNDFKSETPFEDRARSRWRLALQAGTGDEGIEHFFFTDHLLLVPVSYSLTVVHQALQSFLPNFFVVHHFVRREGHAKFKVTSITCGRRASHGEETCMCE